MFDLFQGFMARKMVESHGKRWVLCYCLPGGGQGAPHLALAVECDEAGRVSVPADIKLIEYQESALFSPRSPAEK